MKLRSVTFIDSTFRNCYFDDVTSVGSSFRNCTFIDAFFFNTGETLQLKSLSLGLKYNISDSQIPQMTEKCLTDKKVYWLVINSFLFSLQTSMNPSWQKAQRWSTARSPTTRRGVRWHSMTTTAPTGFTSSTSSGPWLFCPATLCPPFSWTKLAVCPC